MAVFKAYPSHRHHPSLGVNGFVQVEDEQEDSDLKEQDELWRSEPYNEAECEEYAEAHPKAKPLKKPLKKAAKIENEEEPAPATGTAKKGRK